MKTIIICCNYFEGKTGNLEETLKCLQKNKLSDTYISVVDNNSKDNSLEILKKYKDLNVIDYAIVTDKNVGKAKALNILFKQVEKNIKINEEDIILHLDSDIRLINDDTIKHIQEISIYFKERFSFMAFQTSGVNYFYFDIEKLPHYDYFDSKIYVAYSPHGIPGPMLAIPYKFHKLVNGYNECLGKNNSPAIYGGDDAVITKDLILKTNLPCLIPSYLQIFHPETQDINYSNFKKQCINNMLQYGYGSTGITATKGFYD